MSQREIISISAGRGFSLALTKGGFVVTHGNNGNGQLGHGNKKLLCSNKYNYENWQQVQQIEKISMIAAGGYHSAVLFGDGKEITMGN